MCIFQGQNVVLVVFSRFVMISDQAFTSAFLQTFHFECGMKQNKTKKPQQLLYNVVFLETSLPLLNLEPVKKETTTAVKILKQKPNSLLRALLFSFCSQGYILFYSVAVQERTWGKHLLRSMKTGTKMKQKLKCCCCISFLEDTSLCNYIRHQPTRKEASVTLKAGF